MVLISSGAAAPETKGKTMLINDIIAFESGEMSEPEFLRFFSGLLKTGTVWTLQGVYQRTALDLINREILSPEGEILQGECLHEGHVSPERDNEGAFWVCDDCGAVSYR
jgi:hypothetical protein